MTCEARDPPVDLTGPDLEAASCGSSKRSHRPADDIWDHFKKVKLDPATAKIQHRNYNAVCKGCDNTIAGKPEIMKRHLVNCSKASTQRLIGQLSVVHQSMQQTLWSCARLLR